MGTHLIEGEFQSDKYPSTPRGKVPLSVKDLTAQDLLWRYAQRRRAVDAEFSDDLEQALIAAGYSPPEPDAGLDLDAIEARAKAATQGRWDVLALVAELRRLRAERDEARGRAGANWTKIEELSAAIERARDEARLWKALRYAERVAPAEADSDLTWDQWAALVEEKRAALRAIGIDPDAPEQG